MIDISEYSSGARMQNSKQHRRVVENISEIFGNDDRVQLIFATGSTAKDAHTKYSDVDIWIVIREEKQLSAFIQELSTTIARIFPDNAHYNTTSTHYFFILETSVVLDLNIITAAQYFSIQSPKRIIQKKPNKKQIHRHKHIETMTSDSVDVLFLKGTIGLMRILSKIKKKDYWSAPRFIASVREIAIIPLMQRKHPSAIKNIVDIDLKKLPRRQALLLQDTFAAPKEKDCVKGLLAALQLLKSLSTLSKNRTLRATFINVSHSITKEYGHDAYDNE